MGVELMTFAIYFQVLFSLLLKQFHYCEDHSHIHLLIRSLHTWYSSIHSYSSNSQVLQT